MHRLATVKNIDDRDNEIVFINQEPAKIVILTAADTDIQALAAAVDRLPDDFPEIRALNLLALRQEVTTDDYIDRVLCKAEVILVRVLGGVSYWQYGLDVVTELVKETKTRLVLIPGDDRPDMELSSRSNLPLEEVDRIWRYFNEGGVGNICQALLCLGDLCQGESYSYLPPRSVPKIGLYPYPVFNVDRPRVGIIFYRAHYLSGNTKAIDALCEMLISMDLTPVPVFVSSLRSIDLQNDLLGVFQPEGEAAVEVVLNTTSFSTVDPVPLYGSEETIEMSADLWQLLDTPVIQTILSSGSRADWEGDLKGLSARDTAINIALPEVDGRIIGKAISFKEEESQHPKLQTTVLQYEPVVDRVRFVCELAAKWINLRKVSTSCKKVAIVLANYPARDGRIANGVGLDTPASCVEILKALQKNGYNFGFDSNAGFNSGFLEVSTGEFDRLPETGDELIRWLIEGFTNDREWQGTKKIRQTLSISSWQTFFNSLPPAARQAIVDRWQKEIPETIDIYRDRGKSAESAIPISGIQLGNIFIGIQPARGYDLDPDLNYHAPDLEPTPEYLAFYHWLRHEFAADAIIHLGKHGNLEWLPGKSVALSQTCYPEVTLGPIPHIYPFIVNDPGEGSQAKRRSSAVIIDHLTPPMARAELYGDMQTLENLVDEYYEAIDLNPSRIQPIRQKILSLLKTTNLSEELQLELNLDLSSLEKNLTDSFDNNIINPLDRTLCQLKEAQIRDGLHIFGTTPSEDRLIDLIVAISRHPQPNRLGLTTAIAADLFLDLDPLKPDFSKPNTRQNIKLIETIARKEVEKIVCDRLLPKTDINTNREKPLANTFISTDNGSQIYLNQKSKTVNPDIPINSERYLDENVKSATQPVLEWIDNQLLPNLQKTPQEIENLLRALAGKYIPSGPSGAPTRGRTEVLPTGRNFYSIDIRAIPTESAWDVGRQAAEIAIEQYTQTHGEYPRTLGLSIWGTATMRTGGDDIAQALALIGVKPIWDGASRRVVDFEILSPTALNRPRVDVTLRVSGLFRDAFSNLIDLFDRAVRAVGNLTAEPADINPLAAQIARETASSIAAGIPEPQARQQAQYRIFGSKPGSYGAGLQGLIESQNWQSSKDLATAYTNYSSYAYTGAGIATLAPAAFDRRLKEMQIVLQNQDNREHDILDSDDYYQFQGGMTAAVASRRGELPSVYFGDNSLRDHPQVRSLQQEIAKVYRSRAVNPKWIAGMMRHGYKGACEMAATIDFLFGYDATTNCIADYMYAGIADAYLFDKTTLDFLEKSNPQAMRDMAERLLEAHQRQLWQQADPDTIDRLHTIVLTAEGTIESASSMSVS